MPIEIDTLATFREKVGGTEPVPAGVSISAISASFALALLAKVLDITGKRKDFTGDSEKLNALIDTARSESARLTEVAEQDVQAFNQYLDAIRESKAGDNDEAKAMAIRQTIEVPMQGARNAVRGLDVCAEAVFMVHGLTAADLGIAAALLSGAVRGMLISVDFNLQQMQTDREFSTTMAAERQNLELQALRRDDAITAAINQLSR